MLYKIVKSLKFVKMQKYFFSNWLSINYIIK